MSSLQRIRNQKSAPKVEKNKTPIKGVPSGPKKYDMGKMCFSTAEAKPMELKHFTRTVHRVVCQDVHKHQQAVTTVELDMQE